MIECDIKRKGLAVYIHVPFCVRKCLYCDFLSFPMGKNGSGGIDSIDEYVDSLVNEISIVAPFFTDYYVSTVFFGGGTPSLLSGEQVERIMEALKKAFVYGERNVDGYKGADGSEGEDRNKDVDRNKDEYAGECRGAQVREVEATIEANPGTITEDFLEACKRAGINRISIGLQSVNDGELKTIGRIHSFGDFEKSFRMCREHGFKNINVDLMSALPGQGVKDWERSLRTVADMGPEHISAYSLILEEGTPLYDMYGEETFLDFNIECDGISIKIDEDNINRSEDRLLLPDEDTERKMYAMTGEILSEYGYERYEISNYAKKGYECRHNITYWKRGEYIGFGLGASSLIGNVRFKNTDNLDEYYRIYRGDPGSTDKKSGKIYESGNYKDIEKLTTEDMMSETMFLGLRMMKGVSLEEFSMIFKRPVMEVYGDVIEKYRDSRHLRVENGYVFLSDEGINVSNIIMADFL